MRNCIFVITLMLTGCVNYYVAPPSDANSVAIFRAMQSGHGNYAAVIKQRSESGCKQKIISYSIPKDMQIYIEPNVSHYLEFRYYGGGKNCAIYTKFTPKEKSLYEFYIQANDDRCWLVPYEIDSAGNRAKSKDIESTAIPSDFWCS
jgi:hypothetical protein